MQFCLVFLHIMHFYCVYQRNFSCC